MFLNVGQADDVYVASDQTISHGLDVKEPGRSVDRRDHPNQTDHQLQSTSGEHGSAFDRMNDGQVSFHADYHQDQYTGRVRERVDEHVNFAKEVTQQPAVHQIVRQGLVHAEYADAEIGHG